MRNEGFTLVTAIFLLVVLVTLSLALVTISGVAHTTSAQHIQSVRANYAVRAGLEWAASEAATACPLAPPPFTLGGVLNGFTVTVSCTPSSHSLPTVDVTQPKATQLYYVVNIAATSGNYGSPDFVLRRGQGKVLGPVPVPP